MLTLFKLNAAHNAPDGWKQQFKVEASALVYNKEEKCSAPTWACVLCDSVKKFPRTGFCDICIYSEESQVGLFFLLCSVMRWSQPCYFNPPFLRLHIFAQEIKPVEDSGDPLEIQIARVKLLLVCRTAYKCVTKLISFSLNKKCVQPYWQLLDTAVLWAKCSNQNVSILTIIMLMC